MKTKKFILRICGEEGGILVVTMIAVSVLMIVAISLVTVLAGLYRQTSTLQASMKAFYLAQAGIEMTITEFLLQDKNKDWSDNAYQDFYKEMRLGNGRFSVRSKKSQKEFIIISAIGECRGVQKKVEALIQVNWDNKQPIASLLKWHEEITDSLTFAL